MARDILYRVDPGDGTPDDARGKVYVNLKAAIKYAVKLVEANRYGQGAEAYVSGSIGANFPSLNVHRQDDEGFVFADYYDDDGVIRYFDLRPYTDHTYFTDN